MKDLDISTELAWQDIKQLVSKQVQLIAPDATWDKISASRAKLDQLIKNGAKIYGVNTGFGLLANKSIPHEDLETLQENLLMSHAAGTGQPLAPEVVRLTLALKTISLAKGYSGVRPELIQYMCQCFNAGLMPMIPAQGSVGASGDLAPLAHLSLHYLGKGHVIHESGAQKAGCLLDYQLMDAAMALKQHGLDPLELGYKEGLALINGTQVSSSILLAALTRAEQLLQSAVIVGSLTLEAALGSRRPFDARVHAVRRQQGQIDIAAWYRAILTEKSELSDSHQNCDKVQDPYSIRCQPQVTGACLSQLRYATQIAIAEANAVTDNPLFFDEEQLVISAGNFHAEPVALAADAAAVALSELGAIAERRIALMMDHHLSQLPPFLVKDSGLNSGFMIAQVTAAALTAENRHLANPCGTDSLPTSANQEDHVSMATHAAMRLHRMLDNLEVILAIEWLCAAQGLDFRRPLRTSPALEKAHAALRSHVSHYDQDRFMHQEIDVAQSLIHQGQLAKIVQQETQCPHWLSL